MPNVPADGAYQGVPGAFSEDAARAMVGDPAPLLACGTLAGVFRALEEGRARAGVVPLENTLAGAVPGAADLIARYPVQIVAEHAHPISHAVIGVPGATRRSIRRVLSHPVALAQCERWFQRHPQVQAVPAFVTAGAVADVVKRGLDTDAAIASRRAADVYGGIVLDDDVQDVGNGLVHYTKALELASGAHVDYHYPLCMRIAELENARGDRAAALAWIDSAKAGIPTVPEIEY
jgi:prephenate dehydratase